MPAGKVTKATKKIKGSKGFGKGIATQKKIGRVKRSKDERMEKSIKAEAKATKVVPVLARHESAPGRGQGHKASRGKSPGFQEGMKVDDFLESGFEQAMADMSSDEDGEEEAPAAAAASKPKKKEKLSAQLKKLKESDPAFYEYMKKTDQALLEFDSDEEGEEEDDEDDEAAAAGASEAAMMGDGDDEDEDEDEEDDGAAAIPDTDDEDEDEAQRKKGKTPRSKPQIEVTTALVKEWERKLLKGESAAALKQLVAAFRCAVHYGDDDGNEHAEDTPYTFTSGHVFNLLVQLCLSHMDGILRRHTAGGAAAAAAPVRSKSGIERPDQWPAWKRHQQSIKTYLAQLTLFLAKLSEAAMMLAVLQQVHRLTLTLITTLTSTLTSTLTPTPNLNPNPNPNQVHRLAPLYLALPKLVPRLLKELLRAWSVGGSKETCLLAFAGIRQLAAEMPPPFIDTCLKGTYLAFAQACAPPPTYTPYAPSAPCAPSAPAPSGSDDVCTGH